MRFKRKKRTARNLNTIVPYIPTVHTTILLLLQLFCSGINPFFLFWKWKSFLRELTTMRRAHIFVYQVVMIYQFILLLFSTFSTSAPSLWSESVKRAVYQRLYLDHLNVMEFKHLLYIAFSNVKQSGVGNGTNEKDVNELAHYHGNILLIFLCFKLCFVKVCCD